MIAVTVRRLDYRRRKGRRRKGMIYI